MCDDSIFASWITQLSEQISGGNGPNSLRSRMLWIRLE